MTIQTINLGSYANDGTGDDLRTAFEKVNSNFLELGSTVNISNGNNVGNGVGIFSQRTFSTLDFKSLTSSDESITITDNNHTVDLKMATSIIMDTNPTLGADMSLNGHKIKAINGGGIESKIWGIDVVTLNSLVSLLLESNTINIDMGSFVTPTGLTQDLPRGYNLDMGSIIDPNDANNLEFGLIQ